MQFESKRRKFHVSVRNIRSNGKRSRTDFFSFRSFSDTVYGSNKMRRTFTQKKKKEFSKKEEALNYLSSLKKEENWGKMVFQEVDFKNGSGRFTIDDSFEAMTRKTNQPSCHFFRGFIAGFLSELLKKAIVVTEEKCAGKGDKHCEFVFGEQQA